MRLSRAEHGIALYSNVRSVTPVEACTSLDGCNSSRRASVFNSVPGAKYAYTEM